VSADPLLVLTTAAPRFSVTSAAAALYRHFGIEGSVEAVDSERDQNFHVIADSGEHHVLKFANSAEDPGVTDLQSQALLHIQNTDPDFPVPRLRRTLDGELSALAIADDGREHVVRVLSWLDGTPLRFIAGAQDVAAPLGHCLSRLDRALRGFEHPSEDYSLLWDIKRASGLTSLLDNIADADLRETCARQLLRFDTSIAPALNELRWQFIHNDFNPGNVLMETGSANALAGVIDFGDAVLSPLIIDVAVAAAYLCHADDDPFVDVVQFLAAYTANFPLLPQEIEVLCDLILMRNVLTILITNWRAARFPENRAYILRSEDKARNTVARIDALSRKSVAEQFLNACKS
jgi:Ser/Thr protein kinase RdoA (MazF antagonist)